MSVIETKVKTTVNIQNNTTVIHNQKFPDKPSLIKDKFFDYDIYHVCVDGVEMYAVTEILKQYAEINNSSKRIFLTNYMRLDSTKQYIDILYENYNKNNILHSSDKFYNKSENLEDDSDLNHLQDNENDLEFNKRGVILRFSFDGYDTLTPYICDIQGQCTTLHVNTIIKNLLS